MDSTGWGEPMVGGILSQVMFGGPRGAGLAAQPGTDWAVKATVSLSGH